MLTSFCQYSLTALLLLVLMTGCGGDKQDEQAATASEQINYPSYGEPHRPRIHFSPPEKWMNDPNGMVYYDGEYHLFYQYYPDSTIWGPMHWGHAVSEDLLHWENLPIALYPDSLGYIFSGSAVVDRNNSSGLGENGRPPLVAIFTYHQAEMEEAGRNDFQYQGIAYSNDRGRNWTKYANNPVIPNRDSIRDFRDPKVIWYEEGEEWIMVFAANDRVKFWSSDNLIDWTFLSDFGMEVGEHGGVWECPDLFPMQIEGSDSSKWVLLVSINPGAPNGGSGTQYFVGDFDGRNFMLDDRFAENVEGKQAEYVDYGRDNYAGVTWSDVPKDDGRRIFMGWMSNWDYAQEVPTGVWRSAMTLPRSLSLHRTPDGYRLFSKPVRELESLRVSGDTLVEGDSISLPREIVLEYEFDEESKAKFGVELSNAAGEKYRIGYNAADQLYYSDRTEAGNAAFSDKFSRQISLAPRLTPDRRVRMHMIFDVASVELFADDGATVMTEIFFPTSDFSRLNLFMEKEGARLTSSRGYGLEVLTPIPTAEETKK